MVSPLPGKYELDGKDISNHEEKGAMAGRADDGQPIPRVGLRFTLRFQAVGADEDVVSRTWFCRKVIMEQLHLKVDVIYCLQWNQQEKAFDVTLKDEQVYTKVAKDCVAAAMQGRVGDAMGIWTGLGQFQVLLGSGPEGFGGLGHPPASFSLGADRGYLFYPRQPAFCRRCRQSGHVEGGCAGASCRFCGQRGHEAKDCTVPKACHGCSGIDHLYRSCPERRRTFAEVAGANNRRETEFEDLLEGLIQCQKNMFPVGTGEAAAVERVPGGGSGSDSVGRGPAGNTDSTVAADLGVKPGIRKIQEAFGTEAPEDNGDCSQVGDSKRPKTEGTRRKGRAKEVVAVVDEGDGQQKREGPGKDSDQGRGKADDGHGLGGGMVGEDPGVVGVGLQSGLPLDRGLPAAPLLQPPPLGDDTQGGVVSPSTSSSVVPVLWADQMDSFSEDPYASSVRAKKARQVVTGFRDSQGIVVTEEGQVVRVATDHFRDSFKEKDVGRGDDFLELLDRQVPGDIVQALEVPLTVSELEGALNRMNKGKVPGIDGLPVEFYAKFWSILGPVLLEVLTEVLQAGEMSGSLATGVISLLYKKGDRTEIGNWRPLTMLCVDYKLFIKLLAARMSLFLEELIHPDQACAVPGRKITDSLLLIRDTICFARDRNFQLVVLNLDFEKAFDRLSHQYLFQVLKQMGFPKRFIDWVALLYRGTTSKFIVNGHLTKAVNINCGVRQGCPLSALLYIICIEPLAQILRRDQQITGVHIPGSGGLQTKCILYMDDINLLCTDLLSVNRTLDLTDWFGQASGSKLNISKTQAQFYGPWTETEKTGLPLTVTQTEQKILGIQFDNEGGGKTNWTSLVGKVRQRLGYWGLRGLTMEGKVLIIKAVILPLLLLVGSVFIPPRRVLLELERAIFYFLWGSKWERITRKEMKKSKQKGGKGVPDLHLFLGSRYAALHIYAATAPSKNPKTAAMTRFWMGTFLRRIKILPIDLKVPVSFNLPPPYAFIQTFLKKLQLEQEGLHILPNHRSLLSVVQEREPVSPVHGLAFGEPSTVWCNVNHPTLTNRLRDMSWMVAHEILPVRSVMHSRGMAANPTCPRPGCGAPETVRHLLWECSAAVDQWAKADSLQFPCLPAREVLTAQLVMYGVSQKQDCSRVFSKQWLTLAAIKDAIWTSRNLLVRRHMQIPPVAVIRMAAATIKSATCGTPRTQPQRRIASVLIRTKESEPHGKGQSSAGPTLQERQVGRSNRVGVSSEHLDKTQRDTTC
ncbi:uncharacterized protein LOC117492420 [Trematomus bernacchii]|uniref:uncharacterized protein LOC117492420 n=1 Tax=Trematomus bernacchii TaxID=40690 RepID=UPI00146D6443|nr:uncharacterized protein LOC117492420 [Trematomus bernacchii]